MVRVRVRVSVRVRRIVAVRVRIRQVSNEMVTMLTTGFEPGSIGFWVDGVAR